MVQQQQRRQRELSPAPPNTPRVSDSGSEADKASDEGESVINEAFAAINGRPSKYTRRYQEAKDKGLNPHTTSEVRA